MMRFELFAYTRALWILLAVCCFGCRQRSPPPAGGAALDSQELIVSAAVSLRNAFDEIGKLHQQRTKTKVIYNFGASGALQQQLEAGAPADVFASAASRQMNELTEKGLIVPESRRNFARNTLALITPADSTLGINSFAALGDARVGRIAIGNPKTVPAGEYARQLLANSKLSLRLEGRLIYGEDVRQVLDYVARGEVDAGIVYASDAQTIKDRVSIVARAEENLHEPILYPIGVLKDSRRQAAGRTFLELVMSAEGQSVLRRNGFEAAR
ncbi:MAG: molybdate ABC transporter substrate-binding protein [Pyrinomonadaceae bacterium]